MVLFPWVSYKSGGGRVTFLCRGLVYESTSVGLGEVEVTTPDVHGLIIPQPMFSM